MYLRIQDCCPVSVENRSQSGSLRCNEDYLRKAVESCSHRDIQKLRQYQQKVQYRKISRSSLTRSDHFFLVGYEIIPSKSNPWMQIRKHGLCRYEQLTLAVFSSWSDASSASPFSPGSNGDSHTLGILGVSDWRFRRP